HARRNGPRAIEKRRMCAFLCYRRPPSPDHTRAHFRLRFRHADFHSRSLRSTVRRKYFRQGSRALKNRDRLVLQFHFVANDGLHRKIGNEKTSKWHDSPLTTWIRTDTVDTKRCGIKHGALASGCFRHDPAVSGNAPPLLRPRSLARLPPRSATAETPHLAIHHFSGDIGGLTMRNSSRKTLRPTTPISRVFLRRFVESGTMCSAEFAAHRPKIHFRSRAPRHPIPLCAAEDRSSEAPARVSSRVSCRPIRLVCRSDAMPRDHALAARRHDGHFLPAAATRDLVPLARQHTVRPYSPLWFPAHRFYRYRFASWMGWRFQCPALGRADVARRSPLRPSFALARKFFLS